MSDEPKQLAQPPLAGDVNKNYLYGRFNKQEDQRLKLANKLAHKALDIPFEDDMEINKTTTNTTTTSGVGTKGLLGVAAVAGLAPAIVAGAMMLKSGEPAKEPTPNAPTVTPAKKQKEYEAVYERQMPDGTWKVIKREPLVTH